MQLKVAIECACEHFLANKIPSPRLDAERLASFVIGQDWAFVCSHPEHELTAREQARYDEVVSQRTLGCPVQYITGHEQFWGFDLLVSPAVLIPRAETEHVVETALVLARDYHRKNPHNIKIVDVGIGSGCIALALASELPWAEVHGCDISAEAVEVARSNAARLGLGHRVLFQQSDLLAAYEGEEFDIIVCDPPYIGEAEADKVGKQVLEFEPWVAIFSGPDGMDVYRRLAAQAWRTLRPGGWLIVEVCPSNQSKVKALLSDWAEIRTTTDRQGIFRAVAVRKT